MFHSLPLPLRLPLCGILQLVIYQSFRLLQSPGLLQEDKKGSGAASLLVGDVWDVFNLFPASVALLTAAPRFSKFPFPAVMWILTGEAEKPVREAQTTRKRFYSGTWNSPTQFPGLVELSRAPPQRVDRVHPHRQVWHSSVPALGVKASRGSVQGEGCSFTPAPGNPAVHD